MKSAFRPSTKVDAFAHQLSGGQQQRVMIAMAIACEPRLLIADEPTTALDVTIQRQIIELIQSLQRRHHMSVLFITHDLQLVSEIADEVIVMRYGDVKEQAPASDIFVHPSHPYTKALLLCRPPMNERPFHLPSLTMSCRRMENLMRMCFKESKGIRRTTSLFWTSAI